MECVWWGQRRSLSGGPDCPRLLAFPLPGLWAAVQRAQRRGAEPDAISERRDRAGGAVAPALPPDPAGPGRDVSPARHRVQPRSDTGLGGQARPILARELRRRHGKAGAGGRSWFVDETYLRARGRWCYCIGRWTGTGFSSTPCSASTVTWLRPRRSSILQCPLPARSRIASPRMDTDRTQGQSARRSAGAWRTGPAPI
jgi:hypothetical protein